MKTLNDFISQNLGKFMERYDSSNKNQCVDLATGYCVDVLGLPANIFAGILYAYQIFTKPTQIVKDNFDFISNGKDNFPPAGAIVIFSYYYNYSAGHVVVSTGKGESKGKSTDWFEAFSQNDPTGSVCMVKRYSFSNVLGWLVPKKIELTDAQKIAEVKKIINSKLSDTDARNALRKFLGV